MQGNSKIVHNEYAHAKENYNNLEKISFLENICIASR